MGLPEGEEREREEIFEVIITENFPQINDRQQITDPRSLGQSFQAE